MISGQPTNYQYRTARNHQPTVTSQDQNQRGLERLNTDGTNSQDDIINLGPEGFEQYTQNYNDGTSNQIDLQSTAHMQRHYQMQQHLNMSPLVLEDFNSEYIKIKKVPKNAS